MTFTEAAAQVLRLVGKPLHYKEITDVAIEKDLLSHVGKSPEVTMGARLAALVKKGDKENPLVRVKPGVFALREWDKETIQKGLADKTPALKRLEQLAANGTTVEPAIEAAAPAETAPLPSSPEATSAPDATALEEDEVARIDEEERERAELAAAATGLFAPEEDDDIPIFGADEGEEDEDRGQEAGAGRKRRRRRRRGRGGERGTEGDDLPGYTVSDAPVDVEEVAANGESARGNRVERSRERTRERPARERERPAEAGGASLDELVGEEAARAVASILDTFERQGPVSVKQLVEAARKRGRLSGDAQQAQAGLVAIMRADNLRRVAQELRPRFRFVGQRVGLTDWLLGGELPRLEREVGSAVERYREAARQALLERIRDLPHRVVGELVMILLERLGVSGLRAVRRSAPSGADLHLSGVAAIGAAQGPTAIAIRRDGRDIGRERVTELRGSLHHFGPAGSGWILTTGQVLSGAREEAAVTGAAPVKLTDGAALARLCEEHGVGVTTTRVSLPVFDPELFEALRSG